ncbi:hypothetical protein DM01DRAFT_134426 [Hesseltinella vesiculosa]|uniref:AAA+ ATPase domain-containing protein n=1 Tax=Hesseltinella vesiculosa TaxID=101127 RepID=A0A1X2GNE0_9FUNG|nr:hypothetical protein DM01DRAFT_134426 [Hesseltinella vesiculosa]
MSNISADALLTIALDLLQKQKTSRNPSHADENHFYNTLLKYFLSDASDHWWCSQTTFELAGESLWLFSLPGHARIDQYKNKLNKMLTVCTKCAQQYHQAKRSKHKTYMDLFTAENVAHYFSILDAFDHDRISSTLASSSSTLRDEDICALTEMLCHPTWIQVFHDDLCRLFDCMQVSGRYPTMPTSVIAGVGLLSFHDHKPVRLWARKLMQKYTLDTPGLVVENDARTRLLTIMGTVLRFVAFDTPVLVMTLSTDKAKGQVLMGTVQDLSEVWKSLRLILELQNHDSLMTIASSMSSATSLEWSWLAFVERVLAPSTKANSQYDWFPEFVKCLNTLWSHLQEDFWFSGHSLITVDAGLSLVKHLCASACFGANIKFALASHASKVLMRNGQPFSGEKLASKINVMLAWMGPCHQSLRAAVSSVDMLTDLMLDTLLGYFQQEIWTPLFQACAVRVAFALIKQLESDGCPLPVDKLNQYASQWLSIFFSTPTANPCLLPPSLHPVHDMSKELLSRILIHDTQSLRNYFMSTTASSAPTTPGQKIFAFDHVWQVVRAKATLRESYHLVPLLLSAYGPLVSIYTLQNNPSHLCAEPLKMVHDLVQSCLLQLHTLPVTTWKPILFDHQWDQQPSPSPPRELVSSLLLCLTYNTNTIQDSVCKLLLAALPTSHSPISKGRIEDNINIESALDSLFNTSPFTCMRAWNAVTKDFYELWSVRLDIYALTVPVEQLLTRMIHLLVGDEDAYLYQVETWTNLVDVTNHELTISEFWTNTWQACNAVFTACLQWANKYRPKDILEKVMPWIDIATVMIGCQQHFQQLVSDDDALEVSALAPVMDGLSSWIYVTRTHVLDKLVPLIEAILRKLQQLHMKISAEAYDRLMTAATSMNPTRLEKRQKESLFVLLSAHEPSNVIFLDDSEDDDIEWQAISTAGAYSSPSRSRSSETSAKTTAYRPLAASTETPSNRPYATQRNTLCKTFQNTPPATDVPFNHPIGGSQRSRKITAFFESRPMESPADDDDSMNTEVKLSASCKQKVDAELATQTARNRSGHIPLGATSAAAARISALSKQPASRVFVKPDKRMPFAVTPTGRKLRMPTYTEKIAGDDTNTQRLGVTAKSPSAMARERRRLGLLSDEDDDENDSDSDHVSDDEDDGLQGLVDDLASYTSSAVENPITPGRPLSYSSSVIILEEVDSDTQKKSSGSVHELFVDQRRSAKMINAPGLTRKAIQTRLQSHKDDKLRMQKLAPSMNGIYKRVLSWPWESLNNDIPINMSLDDLISVPDCFVNSASYQKIFEPLTMIELWAQLQRSRDMLSASDTLDGLIMESRCHVDDFVDVTFRTPLGGSLNSGVGVSSLAQDDLLCISNHFGSAFFSNNRRQWHGKAFLAKVMSLTYRKSMGDLTVRCFFPSERIGLLNSLAPKSSWCAIKIMSLTTCLREYGALQSLQYYDLASEIYCPESRPSPIVSSTDVNAFMSDYDVNRPQAEAIVGALTKKKGFTLIQGPPGTGKTKTILGLLVAILNETNTTTKLISTHGKILVCAPSNAAVDEICKRLKEGVPTSKGVVRPNVVRIGAPESVHVGVRDVVLERLVDQELGASAADKEANQTFMTRKQDVQDQLNTLQLELEQVIRELSDSNDTATTSRLRDRRQILIKQRNDQRMMLKDIYESQRDFAREMDASRARVRQKVFAKCDIVCATLSGSGSSTLTDLGIVFDTVVVDEAAQAVEVSTLIPLKYNCQRCILVGDPNQLPPTVISSMAGKYKYEQSLFVRLENNTPENVYLLSIQYRMNPEISAFPSCQFYRSKLLDGPRMSDLTKAAWHKSFSPYMFVNVVDGEERMGSGSSIYNTAEAEAAVALVDLLAKLYPQEKLASRIGVITPYKQQLSQLKSRFELAFGSRVLSTIDFNTIDGFQGQEKDIIIFSCVRSRGPKSHGGSAIGFLADRRRMNVGITRAKQSLFVLGNAKTLQSDPLWGQLVDDASRRNLMTNSSAPYFGNIVTGFNRRSNLFEAPPKATPALHQERKRIRADLVSPDPSAIPRVATAQGPTVKRKVTQDKPTCPNSGQPTATSPRSSGPKHMDIDPPPPIQGRRSLPPFTTANPSSDMHHIHHQRANLFKANLQEYQKARKNLPVQSRRLFIPKAKQRSDRAPPRSSDTVIPAKDRVRMEVSDRSL